jgi:hypothetical protein
MPCASTPWEARGSASTRRGAARWRPASSPTSRFSIGISCPSRRANRRHGVAADGRGRRGRLRSGCFREREIGEARNIPHRRFAVAMHATATKASVDSKASTSTLSPQSIACTVTAIAAVTASRGNCLRGSCPRHFSQFKAIAEISIPTRTDSVFRVSSGFLLNARRLAGNMIPWMFLYSDM